MADPDRKDVARRLLASGYDEFDESVVQPPVGAWPSLSADLGPRLDFPDGLAPQPEPLVDHPDPEDPLPQAEVLVVTWTIAELNGLADVLTPGHSRREWHFYRRGFDAHYDNDIRNGAPAKGNRRLGSWHKTRVGPLDVLCYKSELHLNQDGVERPDGTVTLPVRRMFQQLIEEVSPSHVLTVGTSGATYKSHTLGDVVVTRGAKFRLSDEFEGSKFDDDTKIYKSEWDLPSKYLDKAESMMQGFHDKLEEPLFVPPTVLYDYDGDGIRPPDNDPRIRWHGGGAFPAYHPILTTDFFEFGTSTNGLWDEGCAVEMGDAVLGLVCEQDLPDPPKWLVIRNISDPQINGKVPRRPVNMQTHWAVWYYERYGYWTSVNGALVTWAVLAGLADADG